MPEFLRWGVLGTAGIARSQVVPAIQGSRNGRVVAVAGRNPEGTREFAQALGVDRGLSSYDDLLADDAIDAIYIPLPNALHAEWAMRAADAGKAVLCEKPLAISATDAEQVVARFARKRLPLMEGFMYRFHPQNVAAKHFVEDGVIGEVREVRAHLSVDIMTPPDPANVRFSSELGGGSLLDMGCYSVSVVRRMFGEEPETAQGWLHIDPAFGVDVSSAGLLTFSDGRIGVPTASFRANGNGAYTVIGTKGSMEVPRAIIPGMGTRAAEGVVILVDADGNRREHTYPPTDQYRAMAEAFADAVMEGRPVPYSPEDALRNLRALDAIRRSAQAGTAVRLS